MGFYRTYEELKSSCIGAGSIKFVFRFYRTYEELKFQAAERKKVRPL